MRAAFAVIAVVGSLQAAAQEGYSTPREAALRFALANGVDLSTKNVIVAEDTDFRSMRAPANPPSAEQRRSEALTLAKAVGPNARTGLADAHLICIQWCIPRSLPVILVKQAEPTTGGAVVLVQAFEPSDTSEFDGYLWIVTVNVEQRNNRWFGVRTGNDPVKRGVKLKR